MIRVILLAIALVAPALAQRSLTRFVYTGTYAGKPAAGLANQLAIITDCADTTCTTGGGSTVRLMRDTGSAWAVLGDGDSGGSPSFASVTAGTSAAALVMGTGGSLTVSGSGTINATSLGGTAAASYALLASPSFTTPTLGAALATSIAFGADPADAGAIRCSNNATCMASEIATPGADATIKLNTSDQWEFSHDVTATGFRTTSGSVAGFHEFTQGSACTPSANSVCEYAAASIATAYGIVKPSAVGATGMLKVSVTGAVATYSHAALVAGDLPATLTSGTAITTAALTTPVITTNIQPASAGGAAVGTNALPFSSLFIGGGVDTLQVTGTSASGDKVVTLPDATDTLVGKATSDVLTNKTLDVEGTGNAITTVSKASLMAAGGTAAAPYLLWNALAANAPTATCAAGTTETTLLDCYASFPDSDGDTSIQVPFMLPSDWTGAIDLKFKWKAAATTGDVVWQATLVCRADAEVNDAAFNAASTVTDTAKGTTLQLNDASITGMTTTGCAAGELATLKVLRNRTHASDTITGTVLLEGVEVTTRRLQ